MLDTDLLFHVLQYGPHISQINVAPPAWPTVEREADCVVWFVNEEAAGIAWLLDQARIWLTPIHGSNVATSAGAAIYILHGVTAVEDNILEVLNFILDCCLQTVFQKPEIASRASRRV